ncbi:uncharacterized protein METZ01_LOCUS133010, partial [marine metagenome]
VVVETQKIQKDIVMAHTITNDKILKLEI